MRLARGLCCGVMIACLGLACGVDEQWNQLETDKGDTNPNADATHWGDWELKPYLDHGWSGYAIQAKITAENPSASYGDGEVVENDRCDPDCPFTEEATIMAVGQGADQRAAGAGTILGKVFQADQGSTETTQLLTPSNVSLALITESEAKGKLPFNEAQISTFTGFDRTGNAYELGHIEEMDAEGTITQPESLYRRVNGQDQFVVTVVERVLPFINDKEHNSEYFRLSTQWCFSDAWKSVQNISKLVKDDAFDLKSCEGRQPLFSDVEDTGADFLKQAGAGRSDSNVTMWNPDTNQPDALRYKAGSAAYFQFGDGTAYRLETPDGMRQTMINSYVSSKQNCGGKKTWAKQYGYCHKPKGKMFHINWNKQANYKGVEHGWAISKFLGGDPGAAWVDPEKDPDAVALVVHEIRDDTMVQMDGTPCVGSAGMFESDEAFARRCELKHSYTLNLFVLFPPQINHQDWSRAKKVKNLDRMLAAMPDQTQSSPELNAAEKYVDFIRGLERFRAAQGDPQVIDFDLLVDMNTEEDHSTARKKIWDLFTDLKLVQARQHREADEWPEAAPQPEATGNNDEPLF